MAATVPDDLPRGLHLLRAGERADAALAGPAAPDQRADTGGMRGGRRAVPRALPAASRGDQRQRAGDDRGGGAHAADRKAGRLQPHAHRVPRRRSAGSHRRGLSVAERYDIEAVRRQYIGTEIPQARGRYPVEYDAIPRHFHMLYNNNPLFLDPEYAK